MSVNRGRHGSSNQADSLNSTKRLAEWDARHANERRPLIMERSIVGFRRDEAGDWIADLECGHSQHVRHHPPWQVRDWVVSEAGRNSRLGTVLHCRLCECQLSSPDTR